MYRYDKSLDTGTGEYMSFYKTPKATMSVFLKDSTDTSLPRNEGVMCRLCVPEPKKLLQWGKIAKKYIPVVMFTIKILLIYL